MRSLEFQDDIAKPSSSKFECQASQETIAEMITSKQLVSGDDSGHLRCGRGDEEEAGDGPYHDGGCPCQTE